MKSTNLWLNIRYLYYNCLSLKSSSISFPPRLCPRFEILGELKARTIERLFHFSTTQPFRNAVIELQLIHWDLKQVISYFLLEYLAVPYLSTCSYETLSKYEGETVELRHC